MIGIFFYLVCITIKVLQSIFVVTFVNLIAHSPGREFFVTLPEILLNSGKAEQRDIYNKKTAGETFSSTAHLVWFVSTL